VFSARSTALESDDLIRHGERLGCWLDLKIFISMTYLPHGFCSNLLLSGSDLKDVKEMIGHKDLWMTARYAHLTPARKLLRQEQPARFHSSRSS